MARTRRSTSSRKKKPGRTRTRKTKARAKKRTAKRRTNAKPKAKKRPAKSSGKKRAKATPKRRKPDFDEDGVTSEMALALETDADDLVVEQERHTFESPAFTVSTGRPEWRVFEGEDEAEAEALAYVTQTLNDEPELFNQDWLMQHVDERKLKQWVYDAVMEDDYAQELANDDPDRFWEEAAQWRISLPDEDEDGNLPEDVEDEYVEALTEAIAKDRAKDPMDWLSDIYGREDATKKAMEVAGIDLKAAAQDAVDTDGWAHFLATYDGNYETTPGGFVYFRTN